MFMRRLSGEQKEREIPLTYDEEGQTATKGTRGYLFDYEHRLTGVND